MDSLERDGIVLVEPMPEAAEMLGYLQTCQTYHGHVKGASVAVHQRGNSSCWAPEDVLQAPGFLEYVLRVAPAVAAYLGPEALLYSVNAFTTYPMSGPMNPDIQAWHRDRDDVKFVALFIYLTDVFAEADGPHRYQVGTHQGDVRTVAAITDIYGARGTAFLTDGRGLHMGRRPTERPRTIAWARWGVSDPPASYVWDAIQPCDQALLGARYPADASIRRSLRLVVA